MFKLRLGVGVVALAVAACAVDRARDEPPPLHPPSATSAVYTGWRVFQDRCATCHGPAATGTAQAPNLLPLVTVMEPQRFVNLVLRRYDWRIAKDEAGSEGAARQALIEDILQQREPALEMPAWQGEPRVNAHILDLYTYLSARAAGTQGPERPPQQLR